MAVPSSQSELRAGMEVRALDRAVEWLRPFVETMGWDYVVVWKIADDPSRFIEWVGCCCSGFISENVKEEEEESPGPLAQLCRDNYSRHFARTRACQELSQFPSLIPLYSGVHGEVVIENEYRWMSSPISSNPNASPECMGTRVLIPVVGGIIELFNTKIVPEDHNIVERVTSQCLLFSNQESMMMSLAGLLRNSPFQVMTPSLVHEPPLLASGTLSKPHYSSYDGSSFTNPSNGDMPIEPLGSIRQNNCKTSGRTREGENGSKNLLAERRRRSKLKEKLFALRAVVPKISKDKVELLPVSHALAELQRNVSSDEVSEEADHTNLSRSELIPEVNEAPEPAEVSMTPMENSAVVEQSNFAVPEADMPDEVKPDPSPAYHAGHEMQETVAADIINEETPPAILPEFELRSSISEVCGPTEQQLAPLKGSSDVAESKFHEPEPDVLDEVIPETLPTDDAIHVPQEHAGSSQVSKEAFKTVLPAPDMPSDVSEARLPVEQQLANTEDSPAAGELISDVPVADFHDEILYGEDGSLDGPVMFSWGSDFDCRRIAATVILLSLKKKLRFDLKHWKLLFEAYYGEKLSQGLRNLYTWRLLFEAYYGEKLGVLHSQVQEELGRLLKIDLDVKVLRTMPHHHAHLDAALFPQSPYPHPRWCPDIDDFEKFVTMVRRVLFRLQYSPYKKVIKQALAVAWTIFMLFVRRGNYRGPASWSSIHFDLTPRRPYRVIETLRARPPPFWIYYNPRIAAAINEMRYDEKKIRIYNHDKAREESEARRRHIEFRRQFHRGIVPYP